VLCVAFVTAPSRTCEAAEEPRLVDREPFDRVILDEANRGVVLEVFPLGIENRQIPTPRPAGKLKLRPLEPLTDEEVYEVPWENVENVEFFEQLLFDEANRLTSAGEFDEAFDYYARLMTEYPALPGLDAAANDYLHRNASTLFQAKEYDRALAVLGSLYQRSPQFPGLSKAVDAVAGPMIEQHVRQQDYAAARGVLSTWQKHFATLESPGAAAWEERFNTAATRKLDEARQLIAEQKYVAARQAIGRALAIWPELPAAHNLMAEVQRNHSFVAVAVLETSPRHPVWRIDCWPALRTSPLVAPTLAQLVGFGSEGGVYRSSFGEIALDDTGLRMNLKLDRLNSAGDAGDRLPTDAMARYFLAMADPTASLSEFSSSAASAVAGESTVSTLRSQWADALAGVSVNGDGSITLEWSRSHVRPEALLQIPPPTKSTGDNSQDLPSPLAEWVLSSDSEAGTVVFTAIGGTRGRPRGDIRSIIERTMPDDESAVEALLSGEVDVLDRVPPWHVTRLRSAKGVHVGNYRLPTVHVLFLNPSSKLLKLREFRRALCYGIDRRQIVRQLLLGGEELPGFEVLSGPFPTGMSLSDPLRYAYNNRIAPRSYEPRLAGVLASVAWYNVLDPTGKGQLELTDMPTLVLAHPADPMIRVICQTIKMQLDRVGIPVTLREFSADELLDGDVEYDLRYAELAMWEPVVDAVRLLGPGGLAGAADSAYLDTALRKLETASSWPDVRVRLTEIHEIAHYDLPVIPLWQTANYFAYRSSVKGIGDQPITLYQNVERWQVTYEGDARSVATGR
jgi:tetratricopeptide (TPR) repeat protein